MHVRCSAQLEVPSYERSQRLVVPSAMVAWGDRCRSSWEDAARGTASAGVRTASWVGSGCWLCGCDCRNSPWLCRAGPLASGSREGCVGALGWRWVTGGPLWRWGGMAPDVLQGLGGGNLARPQSLPRLGFQVGFFGVVRSQEFFCYLYIYQFQSISTNKCLMLLSPPSKRGDESGISQLFCSNCNTEISACKKKWYQATAPGLKHSRLYKVIVSL